MVVHATVLLSFAFSIFRNLKLLLAVSRPLSNPPDVTDVGAIRGRFNDQIWER